MDILIKNCNLISISDKREKYEPDMDVYISNGKIAKIGKNIENTTNAKVIDTKGKICMPGLINTHTHISMSIFRETLDGYTLQDWLNDKIWPMEDKLTPEDIYYASLLSCIEMITTGTTMANDQYCMAEETIKAANELGMRLEVTRTVNDVQEMQRQRIEELEKLIKEYNNKYENITLNIGIHGLYTTGEDTVKELIEMAKKYDMNVHMHFCENAQETLDIKKAYNVVSPVDVLKKHFTETHNILAHVVKVTSKEIDELSKLKVNVSHCPISNLRLGCGIAKVKEMLDKGINVSLGTDGQGSGSNLDMFETMKFTGLLQKGVNENPKNLESYEILKMATINGAKALRLDDKIGSIEEGKQADLIILDLNTETCIPNGNIFSSIVYNAKGHNVCHTIINGKLVMENRKIEGIDKEKVYKKCIQIIDRIQ